VPTKVVVRDDFSKRRPFWPVRKDADGALSYEDDSYRIVIRKPFHGQVLARPIPPSAGVRIDIDARKRTRDRGDLLSEHGVTCGAGPIVYEFVLNADTGYHAIRRFDTSAGSGGGAPKALAETPASRAIARPPKRNRVRAECLATKTNVFLRLFVNGRLLLEADDASPVERFSDIALSSSNGQSGTTEILFDNLVVRTA
jgi:hypothetical protein